MSLVELLGIWSRRRGNPPPSVHQSDRMETVTVEIGQGRGREGTWGGRSSESTFTCIVTTRHPSAEVACTPIGTHARSRQWACQSG